MNKVISTLERIPGRAYLLLAVTIFAAANSITRQLTTLGGQNLIDGRNPISFCNVLFVGNLTALIALVAIYGRQFTPQILGRLSRRDWLALTGVAVLSGALAPALIFSALERTAVNNVVLIGRIEPPLTLALSALLLRDRVNRWDVSGAVVAFIGVMLTILLQSPGEGSVQMAGLQIGKAELMAAGGAIAAAIATIISKICLGQIPLGVFNIIRTVIGTAVFFIATIILLHPIHFIDAFSPFVWQWMMLYGGVIVVGGQLAWFEGLKQSSAAEVALASSFSPVAGVLAAYLILSEVPTAAQYIGGAVILLGIALSQVGVSQKEAEPTKTPQEVSAQELETGMGFKGV